MLNQIFQLLSKLTIKKNSNFLIINLSYFLSLIFRLPIIWGLPFSISIEPSSLCNLNCKECPSNKESNERENGNMTINNYRNIIDKIYKHCIYLILYFQGEPFINPAFFEMIKYAGKKKIYTYSSTNGHFLNTINSEQIVSSGLNKLSISLDGTDQETYQKYRVDGNFDKVVEGIKTLVNTKKQLNSKHPYIELQFLVFKFNQHQINKIKTLGKELGVNKTVIKSAQIYNFSNKTDIIPDINKYSRYRKNSTGKYIIKNKLKNRCKRLWQTTVITWQGNILPCCFDKSENNKMGNILSTPFNRVWKNKAYTNFRKQILKNRSRINICNNCTEY
ncbi:MAG: radical SAM/SPASM domain-containing protein [Bacteroidota bacterium]|nr:radical SAM/SPASM domain-containing protein [Bacteroidota bacterium]